MFPFVINGAECAAVAVAVDGTELLFPLFVFLEEGAVGAAAGGVVSWLIMGSVHVDTPGGAIRTRMPSAPHGLHVRRQLNSTSA